MSPRDSVTKALRGIRVRSHVSYADEADAILAALAAAGYAVVPVEPTLAVQRALMLGDPAQPLTGHESAEAITRYRAMLAAAQEDQ